MSGFIFSNFHLFQAGMGWLLPEHERKEKQTKMKDLKIHLMRRISCLRVFFFSAIQILLSAILLKLKEKQPFNILS